MRTLRVLAVLAMLSLAVGCGEGYAGREAPPPGTNDPAAVGRQLDSTRPRGTPATAEPAAPATGEAEAEPAADAAPAVDAEKP